CNQKTDTTASNETLELIDPMEGVWEQTNYYFLANGDTIFTSDTRVQHKIYLDGYVMWTADPAPDSSEWHGYGTYTYKYDTLTETLISMSIPVRSDNNIYSIPVDLGKNSFKQVIEWENNDTIYQNIEVYKKLN
ncbi:MAG: hypothetical protein KAT38_02435, partial [Bacteroidales bacterium]|nr:hypothetical protein [Bacteroidales bacterium]